MVATINDQITPAPLCFFLHLLSLSYTHKFYPIACSHTNWPRVDIQKGSKGRNQCQRSCTLCHWPVTISMKSLSDCLHTAVCLCRFDGKNEDRIETRREVQEHKKAVCMLYSTWHNWMFVNVRRHTHTHTHSSTHILQ